jgi:hypothetical protein
VKTVLIQPTYAPIDHPVIRDAILENDVMPRETIRVLVSHVEPILRLDLSTIKRGENQRLIDVVFTMGDRYRRKKQQKQKYWKYTCHNVCSIRR